MGISKQVLLLKIVFTFGIMKTQKKICSSLFAGRYKDTNKFLYMSSLRHKGLGFGFCIAHIFLEY